MYILDFDESDKADERIENDFSKLNSEDAFSLGEAFTLSYLLVSASDGKMDDPECKAFLESVLSMDIYHSELLFKCFCSFLDLETDTVNTIRLHITCGDRGSVESLIETLAVVVTKKCNEIITKFSWLSSPLELFKPCKAIFQKIDYLTTVEVKYSFFVSMQYVANATGGGLFKKSKICKKEQEMMDRVCHALEFEPSHLADEMKKYGLQTKIDGLNADK